MGLGVASHSPNQSDYTFSAVPRADIPRSVFRRDHGHKTTINANTLVPFYVDEALPGDTFNLAVQVFARLATPIVPIMDNLYCDVFFFAVPNRILWTHWVNMMGEQPLSPADSIAYTVPQCTINLAQLTVGSIYDYMGLPVGNITGASISVSALPFRAYAQIWDRWFRDQNMQNAINASTGDGPDLGTFYTLHSRGKRHDYFTSCLPWAQKFTGPTAIAGQATVKTSVTDLWTPAASPGTHLQRVDTGANVAAGTILGISAAGSFWAEGTNALTQGGHNVAPVNLYADLSTAAITINQLRQSFQIQKMLERDARGGTRYPEKILAHFGVTNPDMRMQYPEYLGGGTIPIIVNPVAQTSSTVTTPPTGQVGGTTPQGNLAGFAVANGSGNGFTKSFTEHMTLIGLMQIRADITYQQGTHRMWNRLTQYDYYWPALAHLGEQAVLQEEIYTTGVPAQDTTVFGYQERWAEYRYFPSLITGQFRSTVAQPLDVWHLSQKFTVAPVLGDTFIQDNPPISRVVAVTSQPQFLVDTFFQIKAARPMPVFSVPGLIDHF